MMLSILVGDRSWFMVGDVAWVREQLRELARLERVTPPPAPAGRMSGELSDPDDRGHRCPIVRRGAKP